MVWRSDGGTVTTYRYDALGRRIELDSPSKTHYFYYFDQRVIERFGNLLTLKETFVYGNYVDEVLQMHRVTEDEDYYYHSDDMFNVMAMTDDTGAVVERYEYGDYGEPEFYDATGTTITASAIKNPYFFSGRRYDDESGYYYFRARYMDSKV